MILLPEEFETGQMPPAQYGDQLYDAIRKPRSIAAFPSKVFTNRRRQMIWRFSQKDIPFVTVFRRQLSLFRIPEVPCRLLAAIILHPPVAMRR